MAQKTALTFRTIELTKHKSLEAAGHRSTDDGMSHDATAIECQSTHTPQIMCIVHEQSLYLSLLSNSSVLL